MRRTVRSLAVAAALAMLCRCGGWGGGGGGLVDLTGGWILEPEEGGIPGDAYHLTLAQAGTDVTATFTCKAGFSVGAGTWEAGTLTLSFDFGGGGAFVLTGHGDGDGLAGTYSMPEGSGTWEMERAGDLACANACEPVVIAPFVDVDFTDLDFIEEISLFRSSAGHDYSDDCESCRSMKHYFAPYAEFLVNGVVPVRSPVAGLVVSVEAEGHGASVGDENKQVRIRSSLHPQVTFVLFHVDVVAGLAAGDVVAAGDAIGTARLVYPDLAEVAHDFDVAVRVHTLLADRLLSWFDVVTDDLFATYVARGAAARSDFVITEAARDADPLSCTGQAFDGPGALPAWFELDPPP
jgi:hypothetical protein